MTVREMMTNITRGGKDPAIVCKDVDVEVVASKVYILLSKSKGSN